MFDALIRLAVTHRWHIILATLAMAAIAMAAALRLPIDAVPDITNVQVQINTAAPGYAPLEVEQRVTMPLENVLAGLPRLEQTRSLSRYGLSQVTVIFQDGTDLYFARQLVSQRLQETRSSLPAGAVPALGPVSTGLGEIFLWTVQSSPDAKKADGTPYSSMDLRDIQDWIIKPRMRQVPGVAEVNSIGGHTRQVHVTPDPLKLSAHGLTLADVAAALERTTGYAAAGYIERQGEQWLVRAPAPLQAIGDIGATIVHAAPGSPVRVRDVADVGPGRELRSGAATENGHETVLGTVFMLNGENSRIVAQAAARKLDEINRSLPAGVRAVPVYDRTALVDKAIATVRANLLEGAALVVAILFVFLGNLRAAVITALVIPLAMLFTLAGMAAYHVSANLMSLGALDFGIIVDGAVVIVENCVRRLAHAQQQLGRPLTLDERCREVRAAAREARRPLVFGQLIIMAVYLPVFALSGVEGRMFHPMAFAVVAALAGAMLLSLTFVPAAVALFLDGRVAERDNRTMALARRAYRPLLAWVLRHGRITAAAATVLVAGAALLATRLGSEFAPSLNEGDLALQAARAPGASLTQSVAMQRQLETGLKARFPEIDRIFARTGTAEIASDPMPPNISDGYIMLKPEADWPPPARSRAALIEAIREEAQRYPGNAYELSQPIQLRFNELLSGVRSDVAVKLYGDDMAVLAATGRRIAAAMQQVPGAADVRVEQTGGLPVLNVVVDRARAARYGLHAADVQQALAAATGGRPAGAVFEGDRRVEIVVRLPEHLRNDAEALARLPVALPGQAGFLPLAEVARLEWTAGPGQVSRENGKRRLVVSANVRGRDIGGFVAGAERAIAAGAAIPAGYWTAWGGAYEQWQSATRRLQVVAPLALLPVLALLFAMFRNVKDALLVFTGIPFALTGGVVALAARGIPLSMSAAVGFIALSGVAVLNGLVMIACIRSLRDGGMPLRQAVTQGALARLRPVLMTALVAALGFVPMALATGTGAEVQRPLATVVIGGVLSCTVLTLLVLPVLYRWLYRERRGGTAP